MALRPTGIPAAAQPAARTQYGLPDGVTFRPDLTVPTPECRDLAELARVVNYNVTRLLDRPISDEQRKAAHTELDRYRARIQQYKEATGAAVFDETQSPEFEGQIMTNKAFLSGTANAYLGGGSGSIETAIRAQDNLRTAYRTAYESADRPDLMSKESICHF